MDDDTNTNTRNESDDNNVSQDTSTENADTPNEETNNASDSNDSGDDSANTGDSGIEARFTRLESALERLLGEISAIREAQGIMVENGAVINDIEPDMDFSASDAFIAPNELDLLL